MQFALQSPWELNLTGVNESARYDYVVGLGSNINPDENIPEAVRMLTQKTRVIATSQVWQNPAVGSQGPDYLNAAVRVLSKEKPAVFKEKILHALENKLGRVRSGDKYADRPIDMDILICNAQGFDPGLWTQPHVTIPAAEVAPPLEHPDSGETLQEAAQRLLPAWEFTLREDLNLAV